MFTVTKSITFCYGHRLTGYQGNCRHLHGHNATVDITFVSEKLDPLGMVFDFTVIKNAVKDWIDNEIDHSLLLYRQDPLVKVLQDAGERVTVVDWNPTAENIAKYIFEHVATQGLPVSEVTLWETGTALARYSR